MKAARVHQWGSPEVITVESVDLPEPADEELLVRVHAAGVGPWGCASAKRQNRLAPDLAVDARLGGFGRGREGRREDNRFCCRRRGIRRHQSAFY